MKKKISIALFAVIAMAACKKDAKVATSASDSPKAATVSTTAAAPAATAAASNGFGYTEAPTLEMIPAGPVVGSANGRPFVVKAVYFQPVFGKWNLILHEQELPKPTAIRPNGQYITIKLGDAIKAGAKLIKPMKYGDGYFQIKKPDDATKTTSWNAKNAYAVEITKWDVADYDKAKGLFQVAGTASGRVAIVYQGYSDFKNSFAAGTFTDVPVRYMGKPQWVRDAEKAAKASK